MRTTLIAAFALSACIPMKNAGPSTPEAQPEQHQAAQIAEGWKVEFTHGTAAKPVGGSASLQFSGELVTIAAGYQTPWHGACGEATRVEVSQPIADAIATRRVDLEGTTRMRFGAGNARVITMTCADAGTPPLELVLGNLGNFAMTCIADVCHTLKAK